MSHKKVKTQVPRRIKPPTKKELTPKKKLVAKKFGSSPKLTSGKLSRHSREFGAVAVKLKPGESVVKLPDGRLIIVDDNAPKGKRIRRTISKKKKP